MDTDNLNHTVVNTEIEKLMNEVVNLAQKSKDDSMLLMAILRKLELTHRQIREELFEPSLPDTRHGLHGLLKDIEETGGWPYIERMRLQNLCAKLLQASEDIEQQE